MIKKYLFICLYLLLFSGSVLSAQNGPDSSGSPVVLESVQIIIDGWTTEIALRRHLDLKEGKVFPTKEDFVAYTIDLEQQLKNLRTVADFSIKIEFLDPEQGKAKIHLSIKDGWNFIALPYFKYDTNTGLTASIRARDYNFLGSLEPLRINMDYRFDQNEKSSFILDSEFNLPFSLINLSLNWQFYQALDIRLDQPWGWRGDTSLSASMALMQGIQGNLNVSEGIRINDREETGLILYPVKNILGITFGTAFLIAEDFFGLKKLNYVPLVFVIGTMVPGLQDRLLLSAETGFSNGAAAGRMDWEGNLRSGAKIDVSQRFTYRIYDAVWDQTTEATYQIHLPFHFSWWNLGISLRTGGWYNAAGVKTGAGSYLRGIVDKRIASWWGTFLNIEMPITAFFWKPADWWGWSWARFSQFEVMASPFVDLALADVYGSGLDGKDLWTGGGLEVLIFSEFIKSFFVRASLEYDLKAVVENNSINMPSKLDGGEVRELSFGLGFFY